MTATGGTAGQVYLIGSSGSRIVKIGYSTAPEKRLWFLQVGSPVELSILATFDGGQELESALHHHFGRRHVRGEWFDLGDNPVEAVRAAVALGGAGLSTIKPTDAPRTTVSDHYPSGFDKPWYRCMEGRDLDVRFPPLPGWRAKAVLAARGISETATDWVAHQCGGCPDCLAHFPPRLVLRSHPA
ncbi:GIY-YIG nuclease family protein [Streptomyces sp. BK340]|uniref:GIY-YIG nuclease family protein n=1 Tax=Streptomyces sp. BK340 TaxID=2572903 RepID=UPI0011A9238C|nr:GIY-YIG nuclease family protein [Streptomyces sp. BK340]